MGKHLDAFVRRAYNYANRLNDVVGPGKSLDRGTDVVLILGGSSNKFGVEVCKKLIFEEGVAVVNVDTVDRPGLIFGGPQGGRETRTEDAYGTGHVRVGRASVPGAYHFVQCESFSKKQAVLEALNAVLQSRFGITVFINNINEGLFDYVQGSTDPALAQAPLDLMSKSLARGDQNTFQEHLHANLINVMISVKFFLNKITPQTIEMLRSRGLLPGFYIVNITNSLSLYAPAFTAYYAASKAGLNQFHESLTSELGYNNSRRIKTLLTFLPFFSTHVVEEMPWQDYAHMLIEALKLGRTGELSLTVVPGRFNYMHVFSMIYPIKLWRAYEPWWWEKQLIAATNGYPHIVENVWPVKMPTILRFLTNKDGKQRQPFIHGNI